MTQNSEHYLNFHYTPSVSFHKGDKKTDVNERLITSLAKSVSDIREKLLTILNKVETQHQGYETKLSSLFVPADKSAIAIQGITLQIERLKMRIKDCERLEALCQ